MKDVAHLDWTRTQYAILELLSDGKPHSRREIHKECCGPSTEDNTMRVHIHKLRKRLRVIGQDITTFRENNVTYYQRVRQISTDDS